LYGKAGFPARDWSAFASQVTLHRKERFLVKAGQRYRSVAASEVAFFQTTEGYTFMKIFTGQQYDIDYSLDQLEKLLNPDLFFRVSRNCLVNMEAIGEVIPLSGNKLKIRIKNETSPEGILVSRDRIQPLKKWMDR
jgi:DNA-binding LytR/AlgR family response regulator